MNRHKAVKAYMNYIISKPEFKEEVARQCLDLLLYGRTEIRMPLEAPRKPAGEFK